MSFSGYDAPMSEQQPGASTDSADSSGTTEDSSRDDESQSSRLEKSGPGDIGDDMLPEDLQPTKDNPLARHPRQTGEDDDRIGASVEGSDAENPSANMTYGSNAADSNGPGGSDDAAG